MCKGGGNRDESLNGVLDRRETDEPRGGLENRARRGGPSHFSKADHPNFAGRRGESEMRIRESCVQLQAGQSTRLESLDSRKKRHRARNAGKTCRTHREKRERTTVESSEVSERIRRLPWHSRFHRAFLPKVAGIIRPRRSSLRPTPGPDAVCRCPRSASAPLLLRLLVLLLVHVRPRISVGEKDGRQRVKALMGFYLRGSCPS